MHAYSAYDDLHEAHSSIFNPAPPKFAPCTTTSKAVGSALFSRKHENWRALYNSVGPEQ